MNNKIPTIRVELRYTSLRKAVLAAGIGVGLLYKYISFVEHKVDKLEKRVKELEKVTNYDSDDDLDKDILEEEFLK